MLFRSEAEGDRWGIVTRAKAAEAGSEEGEAREARVNDRASGLNTRDNISFFVFFLLLSPYLFFCPPDETND